MLRKFSYGLAALVTTTTAVVAVPPLNDQCQNATPVSTYPGPYVPMGDLSQATTTPADVNPLGCLSPGQAALKDIWYSFTPNTTDRYVFWAGNNNSLTMRVTVYSACGGTGDVLACGLAQAVTSSSLSAGQTVYIRIATDENIAAGYLNIFSLTSASTNDLCTNATPLVDNLKRLFSTVAATNTPADVNPLGCLSASDAALNDVWFSFTPDRTGLYYIMASESTGSTLLSGYSACGGTGALLGCVAGEGFFDLIAGQTAYLRVSADSNAPATGFISVVGTQAPPLNDLCTNAKPLQYDTPIAFATDWATNTLEDVNPTCFGDYIDYKDIWFSYTPNVTGTFPIAVGSSGGEVGEPWLIDALTSCGGTGQLLACKDNFDGELVMTLNVPGTAGQTVYIRLAHAYNPFGRIGSIQVGPSLPPYNDWVEAQIFAGLPEAFDTAYATHAPNKFYTCLTLAQYNSNDVWYSYIAGGPQGSVYSITLTPSSLGFIPNLTVYDQTSGSIAGCVSANVGDATNGFGCRVVIPVYSDGGFSSNGGTIRVGGDGNTPGNGIIQLDGPVPPLANDFCANAAAITDGQTVFFSNNFATNSSFGSTCPGAGVTPDNNFDVWYRFVPNQNGQVTFSTCGSTAPVRLSTYNDACNTQVACGTTETCSVVNGAFGKITVPATAGTAIRLRVAAFHGQVGDIQLHAQLGAASCPADFNGDSVRDVADLFGFINAWLVKTNTADFNHDTHIDVADLFGFINAWLAGC